MTYSAKKINKKITRPNSVIKPETKSDSPSIKSKGTQEQSAKTLR